MKSIFVWILALLIAMSPVGGLSFIASASAAEAGSYNETITMAGSSFELDTALPIQVLAEDDPLTFSEMNESTWYAMDTSANASDTFCLSVKVANVTDLEGLNATVRLPEAVAGFDNLTVEEIDGAWQLTGNYTGVKGIGFWDGSEDAPVSTSNLSEPVVMPELVGSEFCFMVIVDTVYAGQNPPEADEAFQMSVNTSDGPAVVSSNLTLTPLDPNSQLSFLQTNYSQWYLTDTSSVLAHSYGAGVKCRQPKDLEKAEVSFALANGKKAYAKDLRLTQVNGTWHMTGSYAGLWRVTFWDGRNSWDPHPAYGTIVLPDFAGKQDFAFFVYPKTASGA